MLLEKERAQIVEIGKKLVETGLVTLSWGNLSIRDEASNLIAISPSGVDYTTLKKEDVVIIDIEGNVVEGNLNPSSETPMHLYIYKNRKDALSIIHTHSTYATAIGVADEEIPLVIGELANALGGNVRTTNYAAEGSIELGVEVVKAMEDRAGALMKNHGVVTIGRTLKDAFFNAMVVENAAKIYFIAKCLGKYTTISDEEAKKLHEEFLKGYKYTI
ncbi:class II aldolase/adducin family protein [Tepidimicrobium xylanilyticum]|uniref:L-fuculose-phosphate aldolase n=1 Tax=Tepidimicrobium xylanilyticum TaxID=1123352 RepID=A0A1H3FFV0_9FIRM|nr:class II aldolase/adducin family protein [Tepidimicrobium xylanilyticum]SDX88999.1 L-fuculose-phosphate aldolase [Tepidimicrobium xylanilyticum]